MEMRATEIEHFYLAYIACLNAQDWSRLADFVEVDVRHNNRPLGVAGYRAMLQNDFATIPDLRYEVELLVVDTKCVGSRLRFDCSPQGEFLGLPVNGKRVVFSENVFYELRNGKIARVWSVIDKSAIEAQLLEARNE
jgi:predicted ester cyclase